ncbi:MAG: hypothetical protein HYU69_15185 [Bacteroidetes bacterium]|nr:hypothetical protein [Bacteroidota bacterium]
MIKLAYTEGSGGARGDTGHYEAIADNQKNQIAERIYSWMGTQLLIGSPLTIACWNIRSIRDFTKREYLHNLLQREQIHIMFLQETFLTEGEKLYLRNFKIYRADGKERRKGCAILVSKFLKVKTEVLDKDIEHGRYIKIAITDTDTRQSRTLSNIYAEPTFIGDIPDHIMAADYIIGDMNKLETGLKRIGVYHISENISLSRAIDVPNGMSDHNVIITTAKLPYKMEDTSERKITLQKRTARNNTNMLLQAARDPNTEITLQDPRIIITGTKLEGISEQSDLYEDYNARKEQAKKKFTDFINTEKKKLSAIVSNGHIDKGDWVKINKVLNSKRKCRLYEKDANFKDIVAGFNTLYEGDNVQQTLITDDIINTTTLLTSCKSERLQPITKPRSTALDFFGFSQHDLHKAIKGETLSDNQANLTKLFDAALRSKNNSFFFHNRTKIILFNKVENPSKWEELRGIAILPAWLMLMKKLSLPTLLASIQDKIKNFQYGSIEGRSTGIARLTIIHNSRKFGYNKSVLIDIRKAYDSIPREQLRNKIIAQKLILSNLSIDNRMQYEIMDYTIHPTRGLSQGDPWSPILFNFYIGDTLLEMNTNNLGTYTQAFVDDIIIQGTEISTLQRTFDQLEEKMNHEKLNFNYSKCELLTSKLDEVINTKDDLPITCKTETKYLGQVIDSQGNPTVALRENAFGTILDFISKNRDLARLARIRIFSIYCKSKISHMLPIIALAGNIKDAWKTIRKIIFSRILQRDTTPRECMAFFKLGYYEIMIRPLIKIYNGDYYKDRAEEKEMILTSIITTMKQWTEAEENLGENLMKNIIPIIEGKQKTINLAEWDNSRIDDALKRISRGEINTTFKPRIILPTVLLYATNAKIHELEARLIKIGKSTDQTIKQKEKEAAHAIIKNYVTTIAYSSTWKHQEETKQKLNWANVLEESSLEEYIIRYRVKEIEYIPTKTEEFYLLITSQLTSNAHSANDRIISEKARDLLNLFRQQIMEASPKCIQDIERILDESFAEEEPQAGISPTEKVPMKRGPGRPPKNINKVNNDNQKVTDFFHKV